MIGFRFDIDTHYGLVERTPALLELLERYGIRASFFCVMGHEANVVDIVRLRYLKRGVSKGKLDARRKGGLPFLIRTALWPQPVGCGHPDALREITRRGHELQPHGWKHIQWQRNLEGIDVRQHLRKAVAAYRRIFGTAPVGFASPGRVHDERALQALDEFGFHYAGDMDGDHPFVPDGYRHLQIPVTRFQTMAEMRAAGFSDRQVVEIYIEEIKRRADFCTFYEHPDNLFEEEFRILEQVFAYVRQQGCETVTHGEIWRRYLPAPGDPG